MGLCTHSELFFHIKILIHHYVLQNENFFNVMLSTKREQTCSKFQDTVVFLRKALNMKVQRKCLIQGSAN